MVRRRKRKKMAQPPTAMSAAVAVCEPSDTGGGGDAGTPGIQPDPAPDLNNSIPNVNSTTIDQTISPNVQNTNSNSVIGVNKSPEVSASSLEINTAECTPVVSVDLVTYSDAISSETAPVIGGNQSPIVIESSLEINTADCPSVVLVDAAPNADEIPSVIAAVINGDRSPEVIASTLEINTDDCAPALSADSIAPDAIPSETVSVIDADLSLEMNGSSLEINTADGTWMAPLNEPLVLVNSVVDDSGALPSVTVSAVDTDRSPEANASSLEIKTEDVVARLAPLAESENVHSSEDEHACSSNCPSKCCRPDVPATVRQVLPVVEDRTLDSISVDGDNSASVSSTTDLSTISQLPIDDNALVQHEKSVVVVESDLVVDHEKSVVSPDDDCHRDASESGIECSYLTSSSSDDASVTISSLSSEPPKTSAPSLDSSVVMSSVDQSVVESSVEPSPNSGSDLSSASSSLEPSSGELVDHLSDLVDQSLESMDPASATTDQLPVTSSMGDQQHETTSIDAGSSVLADNLVEMVAPPCGDLGELNLTPSGENCHLALGVDCIDAIAAPSSAGDCSELVTATPSSGVGVETVVNCADETVAASSGESIRTNTDLAGGGGNGVEIVAPLSGKSGETGDVISEGTDDEKCVCCTTYDVPKSLKEVVDELVAADCDHQVTEHDRNDSSATCGGDDQLVYDLPPGGSGEQNDNDELEVPCAHDVENVYEEIKRRGNGSGEDESLFKRTSLVEEVMSEVERVRQRHDQSLQELNLDIENLIMPGVGTPTVSPQTPAPPVAVVGGGNGGNGGNGGGYSTNCMARRPPRVPPHAAPPAVIPTATSVLSSPLVAKKNHLLSTRTLPPLPGEPSPELDPIPLRYPGYSYRRKTPSQRDLYKSKSVPANTSSPSGQTPPSGVKHWLSRLPSLSSFRESKVHSGTGGGGGVGSGVVVAPLAARGSGGDTARWRWSVGSMEEPLYMLYDDTYRLHAATKPFPEDDIYEDIDRDKTMAPPPPPPVRMVANFSSSMSVNTAGVGSGSSGGAAAGSMMRDKRSNSSPECCDDHSDTESLRSSSNMSVASFKGRILNIGRKFSRQHDDKAKHNRTTENDVKPEGKLTRLFSKRKGYDLGRVKPGAVPDDDVIDANMPKLRMTNRNHFPMLPPPPSGLTADQIKRRYIVTTLVQSENSYVASLKKLDFDYKKPLEDNSPSILSLSKIATLFFRIPEILQLHNNFCITLAACVRRWDAEEKMGEVFLSAFSKASVLDIYSDFINNFTSAMELAKLEAKRKSVFTDFLKVKQITSPDRLSFFGLMVKPVQRFPQFILLLQDLLRYTPQGHHDRMSLQLALTQMETLADMLNERKRETDQSHAVKDILRHVSARPTVRSLAAEGGRYLLRQDSLIHLIFNQHGQWTKSKERKLYVLNDLIVCVSSGPRPAGSKGRQKSERMSFKWAVPITDVEVQEDASPILNRMVYAMTAGQSSATKTDKLSGSEQIEDVRSIYQELNDLIHDFEVTSRISALVSTLKKNYPEISLDVVQGLSHSIQQSIQNKDEEVKWIDSCCLQFSVPLKTKTGKLQKELLILQSKNSETKQEWLTDVRLAQLALDSNNSPAWDIPEQDRRPSNKIPLFVKAVPVFSSQDHTEVKCGCFHTTMSNRLLGRRRQDYVWLCSTDGVNSHISVHTLRQMGLRDVFSFDMTECRISSMESVPAVDSPSSESGLRGDTVWMGTESRRILVYCGSDAEHYQEVGSAQMNASVLHIKYHLGQVYVALANGTVAIFSQNNSRFSQAQVGGYWQMKDFTVVTLGIDPVTCLLPVNSSMFCASGHKVCVINAATAKVIHNHSVQHDHMGSVYTMAHSGIGLWLNLRNTPLVCLYHAETFQHLQDINITSSIRKVLSEQNRPHTPRCYCVTTLSTSLGLLWIGTNVGVSLSIPLPRLQGMPILGRRANMSYHANVGPVSMILVLQTASPAATLQPITANGAVVDGGEGDNDAAATVPAVGVFNHPNVPAALYSQPFRCARVTSRGGVESVVNQAGMAKTLPRSWKPPRAPSSTSAEDDFNVYGLYGNLLNVRENAGCGSGDLVDNTDDDLRRSNPDLIPSLVGTLDRRVRLNSGRPRSLDLANLIGGSAGGHSIHHEFNCEFNSSSEDGGSGSQSLAELPEYPYVVGSDTSRSATSRSVSFRSSGSGNSGGEPATTTANNSSSPVSTTTKVDSESVAAETTNSSSAAKATDAKLVSSTGQTGQPASRSVLTLIGGRGYVDLRRASRTGVSSGKGKDSALANPVLNTNDAFAIFWEMKV